MKFNSQQLGALVATTILSFIILIVGILERNLAISYLSAVVITINLCAVPIMEE